MLPLLFVRPGAVGDFLLTVPLLRHFCSGEDAGMTSALLGDAAARLAQVLEPAWHPAPLAAGCWTPLFAGDAGVPPEWPAALRGVRRVLCIMQDETVARNLRRWTGADVVRVDPRPREGEARHVTVQMLVRLGADAAGVVGGTGLDWRCGAAKPAAGALVVHPGSGSPRKCWPADRFAEVAARVATATGAAVTLLAGPADDAAVAGFRGAAGGMPVRVVRERPFAEVCDVLAACRGYVGNDSGITHLASMLGSPVTAVYGPTDARVWGPLGPRTRVLQAPCPAGVRRPGAWRCEEHCKRGGCLEAVGVDEVAEAVLSGFLSP
jgi:hypothetical protein